MVLNVNSDGNSTVKLTLPEGCVAMSFVSDRPEATYANGYLSSNPVNTHGGDQDGSVDDIFLLITDRDCRGEKLPTIFYFQPGVTGTGCICQLRYELPST